jgi:hypothetical protein
MAWRARKTPQSFDPVRVRYKPAVRVIPGLIRLRTSELPRGVVTADL